MDTSLTGNSVYGKRTVSGHPDFMITLIDQAAWDRSVKANEDDGYGRAILKFATEWGSAMEGQVNAGSTVAQCAESCMCETDPGLTGFMVGCAANLLINTWKHGEALKVWWKGFM